MGKAIQKDKGNEGRIKWWITTMNGNEWINTEKRMGMSGNEWILRREWEWMGMKEYWEKIGNEWDWMNTENKVGNWGCVDMNEFSTVMVMNVL